MNANRNYAPPQKLQLPSLEGDLVANLLSMNLGGKLKGEEIKALGESFMDYMITSKKINLIFGQQCSFRFMQVPDACEFVGNQRALMIYNKKYLQANDESQYRHFLRDLEMRGRLPRYYLPEANYALCKMKSKVIHDVSFLAMSWMTDDTKDTLLCLNLLRKVLSFAANLCAIEEMPIVIGGSFRLTLHQVKQVVYNEFEGFRCYGYKSKKSRRHSRMADIFISCPPLKLDDVKPIVCHKIEGKQKNQAYGKWFNPEEAFFYDPVFAKMNLRTGTSVMSSPSSPRALSPTLLENFDPTEAFTRNDCTYTPLHKREVFDSAEKTLKMLLAESERIKELVNEAEHKSKHILGTSQGHNLLNGGATDKKESNLVKSPSYVDLYDEDLIETNNICYMQ